MKRIALLVLLPMITCTKAPLLNDPILKKVDGIRGVYDGAKVNKSLWLITEIKAIYSGTIRVNAAGNLSTSNKSKPVDISFKGKKRTIKELISLEATVATMSESDREEFEALFQRVKAYFGMCHDILLADARGAESMIIQLIKDFCRKYNRPNSLLLTWEAGKEAEMYDNDITNFTTFYMLTFDLKDFLSVLIKSCPKALADYIKLYKKKS